MRPSHPIMDRYLAELAALLPASADPRRDAIAEIRDHLLCEFEARLAGGDKPAAAAGCAVGCVGAARAVAASFVEAVTRRAIVRAEQWAAVAVIGAIVLISGSFVVAPATVTAELAGVVGWFAAQLAAVALVVAWLRGRRLRALHRAGAGTMSLSLRALAVAVGAVALAAGFELAALGVGSRLRLQSAIGLGVALLGTLAGAFFLGRAARRTYQLRGLDAAATAGASAWEELRWTAHRIVEPFGVGRGRPALVAMSALDRVVSWALSHRAGAAVVAGMGAGSVLAAASLREHGLGANLHQALLAVAAAGAQFVIEGGAVVIAVYLFDRVLRLWPIASTGSDDAPA